MEDGKKITTDQQVRDKMMQELAGEDEPDATVDNAKPQIAEAHVNLIAEAMAPAVLEYIKVGTMLIDLMARSNGTFDSKKAQDEVTKLRDAYFRVQRIANAGPSMVSNYNLMRDRQLYIDSSEQPLLPATETAISS